MGFAVNYKNADNSIIPEGYYEVVVLSAFEDAKKNSASVFINMPLVVRNDVEQPEKNKRIFFSIYKKAEPTANDAAHGGYPANQIDKLSKAAGLSNGKQYDSLEQWLEDMEHKPLRVKVFHDEYKGATYAKVEIFAKNNDGVTPTKFPDVKHAYKTEDAAGAKTSAPAGFTAAAEINDDDIPF
ncbi:MAG: DUF669 domain-containing protein [Defluviitaleaceae bacterium]|nr:DUF669 domain-containing protein [Defluviitaleaceae bacterium]